MSKHTIYDSEKLVALRSDYLIASVDRQDALVRWKRAESRRSLFGFLLGLCLVIGLIATVAVWLPYTNDLSNVYGYLYVLTSLAVTALLCAVFGLLRAVANATSEKEYIRCYTSENRLEQFADAIKAETLDPVLEGSIVISVRSLLTASPYEYTEDPHFDADLPKDSEPQKKVTKFKPIPKHAHGGMQVFSSPVNSAVIYIDGKEVGLLDLDSEFSVYRVSHGTHTVKVKIKKEYFALNKTLELETTPVSVTLHGGYRVQLYTVDARLYNGKIAYALKLSEYDDITTFRRDALDTDRLEKLEREADLTHHLAHRSAQLYQKLRLQEKYVETFRTEDGKKYRRENYRWLNRESTEIQNELLRDYQAETKKISKRMLEVQVDPFITDKQRAKQLRALDREIDVLVRRLYKKLNVGTTPTLAGMQEEKLKAILLLGQENIRYEDLARRIRREEKINA
ncbi:MAG: hypothetical protein IJW30_01900 [Clostridia bacterium]|nr:hypothetical protein [Clostridia bacterium]